MRNKSNHNTHGTNPPYLLIGEILRPHGVRGELRVRLLTDYPERISDMKTVYVGKGVNDSQIRPYQLVSMRMHKDYGLITFDKIKDRDEADRLRSLYIMVKLEDAVPLEEGEFYLYQLIGLKVKTENDTILGTISDIIETGANDVYVIDNAQHGQILFPVIEQTILETNIKAGYVRVSPPEGLLPD